MRATMAYISRIHVYYVYACVLFHDGMYILRIYVCVCIYIYRYTSDSFICDELFRDGSLVRVCDMTRSCVRHDSFIRGT